MNEPTYAQNVQVHLEGVIEMKGYVVIDTEIINSEAYSEFVEKVPEAIAASGGRFLVRTSNIETIEGEWGPKRLVILEFNNLAAARAFISSSEYTALNDVRHRAAKSSIRVVEGYGS